MRYFSSEKNKAIWERKIAQMEEERERRKQGIFPDKNSPKDLKLKDANSLTRRINYYELEQIVRVKNGLSIEGKSRENLKLREMEQARGMAKDGRELD